MRKILLFSLVGLSLTLGSTASAFESGDTAYFCNKQQKFLWIIGPDKWNACPTHILSKSGSEYKVLGTEFCCINNCWDSINQGQEKWVNSSYLWSSRSSCEDR